MTQDPTVLKNNTLIQCPALGTITTLFTCRQICKWRQINRYDNLEHCEYPNKASLLLVNYQQTTQKVVKRPKKVHEIVQVQ